MRIKPTPALLVSPLLLIPLLLFISQIPKITASTSGCELLKNETLKEYCMEVGDSLLNKGVAVLKLESSFKRLVAPLLNNSAPVISSLNISVSNDGGSSSWTITASFAVSDPDGDPVKNITDWQVWNGTAFESLAVLNLPFENHTTSASTALDYSTYGNDGTVSQAVFGATAGHDGFGAYEFDAVDDYILVPDSNSLDTGKNFSISVWFKSNNTAQEQAIYTYGFTDAAGKNGMLGINNGKLEFRVRSVSGTPYVLYGKTSLENYTWYHVLITYDGSNLRMYLNGQLENESVPTYAMDMNADSRVYVGRYRNPATLNWFWTFNGTIDDLIVFNDTLSEDDALALYSGEQRNLSSALISPGKAYRLNLIVLDGKEYGASSSPSNVVMIPPEQPPPLVNGGPIPPETSLQDNAHRDEGCLVQPFIQTGTINRTLKGGKLVLELERHEVREECLPMLEASLQTDLCKAIFSDPNKRYLGEDFLVLCYKNRLIYKKEGKHSSPEVFYRYRSYGYDAIVEELGASSVDSSSVRKYLDSSYYAVPEFSILENDGKSCVRAAYRSPKRKGVAQCITYFAFTEGELFCDSLAKNLRVSVAAEANSPGRWRRGRQGLNSEDISYLVTVGMNKEIFQDLVQLCEVMDSIFN